MRNLISLADLTEVDVAALVRRALCHADLLRKGSAAVPRTLGDCRIGLYFRKSSTRTRTAFWGAATLLGAHVIGYGPDDLQVITGESLEDTGRVLARYLDCLVVRTNDDVGEIRRLGAAGDLAVVNALSEDEHPTQAIADLAALAEEFGGLAGRHLLYVGEGNSSAWALALAASLTPGLRLTLLCPAGYEVPWDRLELLAKVGNDGLITQVTERTRVAGPVDAIYTSRWQTMGVPKQDPDWRSAFDGFQVDAAFMDRVGGPHTIFLHDLPAIRGQEVTDDVLDGDRGRAWRQAFHKMTAAMAVLEWCISDDAGWE